MMRLNLLTVGQSVRLDTGQSGTIRRIAYMAGHSAAGLYSHTVYYVRFRARHKPLRQGRYRADRLTLEDITT